MPISVNFFAIFTLKTFLPNTLSGFYKVVHSNLPIFTTTEGGFLEDDSNLNFLYHIPIEHKHLNENDGAMFSFPCELKILFSIYPKLYSHSLTLVSVFKVRLWLYLNMVF